MSFDAKLVLDGINAQTVIPIDNIYSSAGKKDIGKGNFLYGILLPTNGDEVLSSYKRYTYRGSFDYPVISCSIVIKQSAGLIQSIKMVMGAASTKPIIVPEANDLLKGLNVNNIYEELDDLIKFSRKHVSPFKDTRVDGLTRRSIAAHIIKQAINDIILSNKIRS